MLCGTPVVTSEDSAMEEVAGGAAELVDPRDVESIAAGIERALARRDELRAAGLARAQALHVGVERRGNRAGLSEGRRLTLPLVAVDADVLGRRRTGEETYVLNLLRMLPELAPELRIAAITRHPELVPDGIEPIELAARSQEMRMAWTLPRLLRRLRPAVAHFQHALPLGYHGRAS